MNTKLTFGEWFIIVVSMILLIGILLRIGEMGRDAEALTQMQIMYYKAISGSF